jgi:hypothetical protein
VRYLVAAGLCFGSSSVCCSSARARSSTVARTYRAPRGRARSSTPPPHARRASGPRREKAVAKKADKMLRWMATLAMASREAATASSQPRRRRVRQRKGDSHGRPERRMDVNLSPGEPAQHSARAPSACLCAPGAITGQTQVAQPVAGTLAVEQPSSPSSCESRRPHAAPSSTGGTVLPTWLGDGSRRCCRYLGVPSYRGSGTPATLITLVSNNFGWCPRIPAALPCSTVASVAARSQ